MSRLTKCINHHYTPRKDIRLGAYSECVQKLGRLEDLEEQGRLINIHEVAVLLAETFKDDCACNFFNNDEWLPDVCDFAQTCCPNVEGVACWEQYVKAKLKELKEGAK